MMANITIDVVYSVCLGNQEWMIKDNHGSTVTQYGDANQIQEMWPSSIVIPIDPFTAHQEGMITWSQMQVSEAMKAWFHLLTEESKNDG